MRKQNGDKLIRVVVKKEKPPVLRSKGQPRTRDDVMLGDKSDDGEEEEDEEEESQQSRIGRGSRAIGSISVGHDADTDTAETTDAPHGVEMDDLKESKDGTSENQPSDDDSRSNDGVMVLKKFDALLKGISDSKEVEERLFLFMVESEIEKINTFYCETRDEFDTQTDTLAQQVQMMLELKTNVAKRTARKDKKVSTILFPLHNYFRLTITTSHIHACSLHFQYPFARS